MARNNELAQMLRAAANDLDAVRAVFSQEPIMAGRRVMDWGPALREAADVLEGQNAQSAHESVKE